MSDSNGRANGARQEDRSRTSQAGGRPGVDVVIRFAHGNDGADPPTHSRRRIGASCDASRLTDAEFVRDRRSQSGASIARAYIGTTVTRRAPAAYCADDDIRRSATGAASSAVSASSRRRAG